MLGKNAGDAEDVAEYLFAISAKLVRIANMFPSGASLIYCKVTCMIDSAFCLNARSMNKTLIGGFPGGNMPVFHAACSTNYPAGWFHNPDRELMDFKALFGK